MFGGPPPDDPPAKWHHRPNGYPELEAPPDDVTVLTETWDGCEYIPAIEGLFGPNVDGLGNVEQILSVRDPRRELAELFCLQTPGPRAYHAAVSFEERLYLFGGKQSESVFHADTWYREPKLPVATILRKPRSRTPDPIFSFGADKPGVYFEYRVWDPVHYKELRPWTEVVGKTNIGWLNWREGGPGNGKYTLYVRAIDAANNRDERFIDGQNVYEWYYVSPIPWDIIMMVIGSFIGLCIIAYMEYRRRVKKAAMERYAMKRMRRKFKAMQRDINGKAVDWRTLYMENKQNEEAGLNKRVKKKKRDKNAEKREKEKKKREKEKEKIKKKLKAAKEFKDQSKGKKSKVAIAEEVEDGIGDLVPTKEKLKATGGGFKSRKGGAIIIDYEEEAEDRKSRISSKRSSRRNKGDLIDPTTFEEEEDDPLKFDVKKKQRDNNSRRAITVGGLEGVDGKVGTVPTAQQVLSKDREISAGELASSKNTEGGAKQRKVNKQLKIYEEGKVDPTGDDEPEPTDQKGNVEHKKED